MQFKDLRMKYKVFQERRAWVIWIISILFVMFQFCVQLSAGEMLDGLMESFSLSAFGGGLLVSVYYYIYVLLQTPAGMLMDRYGPRRLLTIGAFTCGVGCFLFAEAGCLQSAVIGRLLMGAGAAVGFVGSLAILARWFPANRFGTMVGILEMMGMMGTTFAGYFIARWIQLTSWRAFMLGAGSLIVIISLLNWIIVRDRPRKVMKIVQRTNEEFFEDLKGLLRKKVAWINGIYSGLMFSVATVFTALWGVNFLRLAYHLDLAIATLTCNYLFIGIAIGCPTFGWIDARYDCRRLLCVLAPIVSAILLSVVIYYPHLPYFLLSLLITLIGFFTSVYVVTFVISQEISTTATRSASVGFTNMLCVGSAPLFQPLVGLILSLLIHHEIEGNTMQYHLRHYQWALTLLPVVLLVGTIFGYLMPPRTKSSPRS